MRDIRTGILIVVPAAVALASIIWFLRRKASKKDRGGKDPGTTTQPVKNNDKPKVQVPVHPLHRECQGITLTQRKIPEASAGEPRDSGQPGVDYADSASELRLSTSRSVRESDGVVLEHHTESNCEDILTSSERVRVQELMHSVIDVGIVEASQSLKASRSDVVNENQNSFENRTPKFTEKVIQESMTATMATPAFHTSSSSSPLTSRSVGTDNRNNNCPQIPSHHASMLSNKSDSQGVDVDDSDESLAYKRDNHLPTEDLLSSVSALNSSLESCRIQHDSSSHDDPLLSHPTFHQAHAPVEYSVTSVEHFSPLESKNRDISRSVTAKPSVTSDSSDILSLGECSHSDSREQISEKSSTDANCHTVPEKGGQHRQLEEPPANSMSPVCDSNSVGSNDSGRGGSEQDSTTQSNENFIHFDFNMPSDLCGRLIGRQGKNINYIKTKSGASVSLTNNPFTPEFQICQVIGSQNEVDEALALIRRKFPLNSHPGLTMAPLNLPIPTQVESQPVIVPEGVQLSLPEGVSVDVYVSAIVNAGHVFVQQPTHRTFMSLEKLNFFLNTLYGQDSSIPSVPEPVECGVICVCENEGSWYRAMITSPVDENCECQVKFVDYGGYAQLPASSLKQIRTDFMSLPFQAVECFMANLSPASGENFYSDVATLSLSEKTQLKLLKCQVVARSEDGTPFIHLYDVDPNANAAVMLNQTLVDEGLVQWVEIL